MAKQSKFVAFLQVGITAAQMKSVIRNATDRAQSTLQEMVDPDGNLNDREINTVISPKVVQAMVEKNVEYLLAVLSKEVTDFVDIPYIVYDAAEPLPSAVYKDLVQCSKPTYNQLVKTSFTRRTQDEIDSLRDQAKDLGFTLTPIVKKTTKRSK